MLTPPRFRTVLPVVVSLAVAGCHSRTNVQPGPKPATSQAPLRTVAVADDGFSTSVHRLLREGKPTPDRLGLLAGVVARQLKHASERFGTGQPELGLASITGALLLVRVGEFRMEMFEGSQTAFAAAIAEVAPRGDEGRAVAFLTMQNAISPQGSPARKDGEDHLAALRAWMIDTRKSNSLEALGGEQKVQAMRSLVEPTPESLEAAQSATVRWIEQSLKMKEDRRVGTTRPRREDELEAFRAFRSGAETLAALHLRHGDAKSALDSIDNSVARKVAPPSFYERLDRAANGGDAAAWKELLAWLWKDSPGSADSDPSLAVDPNVLKAALFGTALQAYRLDPTVADVNLALATLLVQIGLPEAVPPVLADAATLHPDPALLSASFRILLETILRESEADDILTARRVYTASRPLLTFASKPEFIGRVEPSAGRMQLAMGTIETRAGNLEAAKPLLESSSLSEPTVEALLKLAAIERQARQPDAALAQLTRALGTPQAKNNPLAAGEAHLNVFEIQRDLGASDKAKAALNSALAATLDARKRANNTVAKGHAERLLARVLFRFSDGAGVARATERAFVAAGQDKHELAATVLDAAQRAFLRKDITAARTAVNRGLAGELPDDDLVYAALWLHFTEKDVKAKSDGTASRALASIHDDGRWPSRLSLWGLGRVKDADLIAAARTPSQKTEATFYTAIARKIAGDATADQALAEVSKSSTIDLVEVQLARELLAGPARFANGPMPSGVTIP